MRRQAGLTLLELMVVVFILSALALSAVSLVGRTDHQVRYEDTQGRLDRIRRATVGDPGAATLAGYVVDTGVLPVCTADLVAAPTNAQAFGIVQPDLYSGVTLPGLPKGWRGPYVVLPPSGDPSDPRFRDGWGNVSRDLAGNPDALADATQHGWVFALSASNDLTVTSYGADGLSGDAGETAFDADLSVRMAESDWRVDLAGWSVRVRNTTAADETVYVAVLVYEYDPTDGVDGHKWTSCNSDPVTVTAGAEGDAVFPADRKVPVGRHLLVVVDNSAVPPAPFANPSTQPVSVRPRTLPGDQTLVIR